MNTNFGGLGIRMPAREYDVPTAVTFLIAGLGIGSIITLLLAPRSRSLRSLAGKPASARLSPAL